MSKWFILFILRNIRIIGKYVSLSLVVLFSTSNISGQSTTPCTTKQFAKVYRFNGYLFPGSFDTIPGGMLGSFGKNYKQIVFKSDNDGNLLWSHQYTTPSLLYYNETSRAVADKVGNIFFITNDDCISLADGGGNLVTNKKLILSSEICSIVELGVLANNNKIVVVNEHLYGTINGYRLICLSPDISSVVWSRRISGYSYYANNMTVTDSDIFVSGKYETLGSAVGSIIKYNSSGVLQYNKQYSVDNKPTYINEIRPYNNGCVVSVKYYGGATNNHIVLRIDNSGDILNSYRLQDLFDNAILKLTSTAEGDFYGLWGTAGGFSKSTFFVTKTDNILWCRQTLGSADLGVPIRIINSALGLLTCSAGNYNAVGVGAFGAYSMARLDANGRLRNCSNYNFPFTKAIIPTTSGASALICEVINSIVLAPVTIIKTVNTESITEGCNYTNTCSTLNLVGSNTICNSGNFIYTAQRNNGCSIPINWTVSGSNYNKQVLSDSSISVQFLQSGNYVIICKAGNCSALNDTLNVAVTLSGSQPLLDLGPSDTLLCKNNTIILDASQGFSSYLWQDNSTNSTYTVTQPGVYFVKVTDGCGGVFSDTIHVNAYPPISFNVGADRTKCNEDTIHLNAPSGFYNYRWSPTYFINLSNSQNVVVQPMVDTTYTIRAEKFPGCLVFDTVKVFVKNAPTFNLGPDKYICKDSLLTLYGPGGYISYIWSTGANNQNINVLTSGNISLESTYTNGCIVADTIAIFRYPKPQINLNIQSIFCVKNDGLDAGLFISYLWNDGSSQRTHSINSPGEYSVTVTDSHGCKGSDTARILAIQQNPKNFLPNDTFLCFAQPFLLQTNRIFTDYLWNTGSIDQKIYISQPGTYSLTITDEKGCKGTDSINILSKACLNTVLFPTAFTPNGDTKNDLFRPQIFGEIKEYEFVIYNRYAELIFKTNRVVIGWDGQYRGILQNPGSFVYVCKYRGEKGELIIQKGSFLLVR